MSRSGGRLNLTGALNRSTPPSHLNPLTSEPSSKHASVCRLERELKTVKEENNRLKEQLEDTRSALMLLTSEASLEKFDERRVNILKMQIIQLQRQVLQMSEALGSRSTALMEVENAMTWLSDKFRQYITADVKGPEVHVLRSDLVIMVETSESARIKLFKNIENCSKDNLSRPQMMINSFLKPGLEKEFTMLDCCLGRTDSLNLKYVAQMESKLSTLYKELIKVSEYLNSKAGTNQSDDPRHMSNAIREREGTVILRACAMSRDCAADLLSLSLLFPSAPWPALKRPAVSDVTYDALAPHLPPLSRSKAAEVQQCVTAALKACNHRCYMLGQEAGALREEVRFHQDIYQLQLDYIQQVYDALRQGYSEFEQSTNEVVIQPMKKLMEAYMKLKNNTSQAGLRDFLTILKTHEQQWAETIQKLDISDPQHQSGSEALSAFGQGFFTSLDRLVLARQTQRDCAASKKEELKSAQRKLEEELRTFIRDGEEQQKIVKELKGKDSEGDSGAGNYPQITANASVMSQINSSSHMPDQPSGDSAEPVTWLRPWLDDQNTRQPGKGKKKGKQIHKKPWVYEELKTDRSDGTENRKGPTMHAESEIGSGLQPWLDEHCVAEEKRMDENQTMGKRRGKETPPVSHYMDEYVMGDSEAQSHRSVSGNDSCRSNVHLGYSDNNSSTRLSNVVPNSWPESSDFPETQRNQEQEETVISSDNQMSDKPPLSSVSKHQPPGPVKGKGRTKPRNYEPKLYVANRTLSLRRSGSLTKLSTPSFEEQMKMSASPSQEMSSSRTSSRQSSK